MTRKIEKTLDDLTTVIKKTSESIGYLSACRDVLQLFETSGRDGVINEKTQLELILRLKRMQQTNNP